MKKLSNLVKYQLQLYFKGSRFVMPLIVTAIFLYTMYSIKPLSIVSSFLITGVFLFLLTVWIGLTAVSVEDPTAEQLLLLRVKNDSLYYLSKCIYVLAVGLLANILCTVFPVIQNILNGGDMFTRDITLFDCVNAFLLQCGCVFIGSALGSLFHPRVMKDRRLAILLTVFLTILTLVRTALAEKLIIFRFIAWIFPPVMNAASQYGNAEYFQLKQSILIMLYMIVYGSILFAIKTLLCKRNKF